MGTVLSYCLSCTRPKMLAGCELGPLLQRCALCWQVYRPVGRHLDPTAAEVEEFDRLLPFACTQNQPDGRRLVILALMSVEPA
jgi:hypothetical protein